MLDHILFDTTGKITQLYDPTAHEHPSAAAIPATAEQIANIAAYRVNPSTREIYPIPTCSTKYIKVINNVWIEMTAEEKAALDAAQAAEAARIAAKNQAIADNLPNWAAVDTAVDNILDLAGAKAFIKKLARVVYWDVKGTAE